MRTNGRTILGAVVTASVLCGACEKPAPVAAPPPEVYVADVVQKDVPVYLELVGQTVGFQDVEIRARVEGFLGFDGLPRGFLRSQGRPLVRN
jgi:membrane fusion protein (multidrug efflux system)